MPGSDRPTPLRRLGLEIHVPDTRLLSRGMEHCADKSPRASVLRMERRRPRVIEAAPCTPLLVLYCADRAQGEAMSADIREITAKRLFIGGEWADAEGGRTFEDRDPFNGELVAEVAAGSRADARPRGRGGRGSGAGLGADAARRAAGRSSSRPPTCSRAARTRSSRCSRARPDRRSASGCSRCTSCPGLFRQAAALAYAPIGEVIPSDIGRLRDGAAAPGRRRRRDRAVERGADPVRPLDRRAARARQHRRAQAVRVVAGRRAA